MSIVASKRAQRLSALLCGCSLYDLAHYSQYAQLSIFAFISWRLLCDAPSLVCNCHFVIFPEVHFYVLTMTDDHFNSRIIHGGTMIALNPLVSLVQVIPSIISIKSSAPSPSFFSRGSALLHALHVPSYPFTAQPSQSSALITPTYLEL